MVPLQTTSGKPTASDAAYTARYQTKAQRMAAEAVRAASEAAAERRFHEAMTRKMADLQRSQQATRAKLERRVAARAAEAERAAAIVARRQAEEAEGLAPTTLQVVSVHLISVDGVVLACKQSDNRPRKRRVHVMMSQRWL